MIETRAPFNGKKKELAGVFIRLPISVSDAAAFKIKLSENHIVGDAILAIGTPVTGGERDYEATVAHYEGKLAERDAEISRLWAALDSIGMEIDSLPSDNEYGARISVHQMQRQALTIVEKEIKALKGAGA